MNLNGRALILFSGGIDSTTSLYWAKNKFNYVLPVIINYSQRHSIETEFAKKICKMNELDFKEITIPLNDILHSALLNENEKIPDSVEKSRSSGNVPVTYVPFRNGLFLSLAAGIGESLNIRNIVTGFNLIDTPDYPDTTSEFTIKMEEAINQGSSAAVTGEKFKIHIPLIKLKKYEIIKLGFELGADYSYSISCYRGKERPCMSCPSCDIRNSAFKRLKIIDPLIQRLEEKK